MFFFAFKTLAMLNNVIIDDTNNMIINNAVQGRSQEETTTEANTRSVVRNQPYEIF